MGSKIYIFDSTKDDSVTTNVLSFDCRSHTVQPLPSIDVNVYTTVADIINGKIYVLGYHNTNSEKPMVVLNTETQTWEPVMTIPETVYYMWPPNFVMMVGIRCICYVLVAAMFRTQRKVDGKRTRS